MKTTKFFIGAFMCLTLATTFTSCSDDDDNPDPVNPTEFITNVTLTFTNNADANDTVVLVNTAPDGQDGAFTNNVSGPFTAGATYSLSLGILDGSDPADVEDKLNEDIIPEADEHFFVYGVNGVNLTMSRDADDIEGPSGSNLGVNTTWVAGAASSGTLQIILVHEPVTVDDTNEFGATTGGEEDFRITFENVTIQ